MFFHRNIKKICSDNEFGVFFIKFKRLYRLVQTIIRFQVNFGHVGFLFVSQLLHV